MSPECDTALPHSRLSWFSRCCFLLVSEHLRSCCFPYLRHLIYIAPATTDKNDDGSWTVSSTADCVHYFPPSCTTFERAVLIARRSQVTSSGVEGASVTREGFQFAVEDSGVGQTKAGDGRGRGGDRPVNLVFISWQPLSAGISFGRVASELQFDICTLRWPSARQEWRGRRRTGE